ncbi:MAG: sigma-70 family RNA polymerase sigma factor [Phycisphaerales bacterium]|nr:sigma-70 family RNA polymerase sigma factor [Phycisphaerales bacterium]
MSGTPDTILDELLVLDAQRGDAVAFERLVRRWQPRLLRHACRLIGSDDAGAEVVQESWSAIVRQLRRLDDPAAFPAWAFRIVTRRCADWIRRRQRDRRREASVDGSVPSGSAVDHDAAAQRDQMVAVRVALDALPEESRTILALYYIESQSVRQIAHALSIPDGTVKSRLFHARNRLRQILEERT